MKMVNSIDERRLWVLNDEFLYTWWKNEGGSVIEFCKKYGEKIDEYITQKLVGK